jgi:hypothetical protein
MPDLTAVFGTACPPRGLSGALRNLAFEYSEGTARHWLTLLLADRVDVLESAAAAVLKGNPDNFIAEKGWIARLTGGDEKRRRRLKIAAGMAAFLVVRRFGPQLVGPARRSYRRFP